jgi:hypothetical protein
MKLLDLTAIDRLIDFNSEESLVRFFEDDKVYTLEEFRDLYNENNWNLSIDEHTVTSSGKILRTDDNMLVCETINEKP